MNQEQKQKMKLWKKITIVVVPLLIVMFIVGSFLDKYDLGISTYKKHDYKSAYKYFKQVKPDHKNYADAVKMAELSKIKMDSVELVETNLEKLTKEKELAEENAKAQKKISEEQTKLAEEKIKQQQKENRLTTTPKADTRQEKIEKQFSGWSGAHTNLERYIKDNMNDPDSYEHVETSYKDYNNYILVITKYRGTNKFGAKVLGSTKAKVDIDGNVLEIVE